MPLFAGLAREGGQNKLEGFVLKGEKDAVFNCVVCGGGAGGLCLWPAVDRMFVTYEGSTIITWASIKNLRRNPQTDEYTTGITGGNGLGGMAVNDSLYVISRNTSRLYAFAYDTYGNSLIPVPLDAGHVYHELEDITTGIDIAIDETGSSIMGFPVGRLYVSDLSETVRYYNMVTWQKEGSITLGRSAIGIGFGQNTRLSVWRVLPRGRRVQLSYAL